jgi:hypothetical protein
MKKDMLQNDVVENTNRYLRREAFITRGNTLKKPERCKMPRKTCEDGRVKVGVGQAGEIKWLPVDTSGSMHEVQSSLI